MPQTADVVSNIIATLALTEPTLDTSIGSVTRKIIDAVAGTIAENSNDRQLVSYTYDIDSKSGGDLDDFVALFGMSRLQAKRATGVVTFSRSAATAKANLSPIPLGTQVTSTAGLVYQTIMSTTLGIGQLSVDVAIQAVDAGPNGNTAAGTITNIVSSITGITSQTNAQPLVNGALAENDAALRARFKATALRNIAGTDQMYRAMALQTVAVPGDPTSLAVTAVNVIGPRTTYQEQIQIVSGTGTSSIPDAAFIYSQSVFFGPALSGGQFYNQGTDQQYSVVINNAVYPATLRININDANVPDGVYDLQFDYVSQFSRNDPFGTRWTGGAYISTRVDVWVNGVISQPFTQSCVYSTAGSNQFTSGASDPKATLANTRFKLLKNGASPAVGDYFMPLLAGPILSVPATMTSGGTYTLGTHYDIVYQSDAYGGTPTSRFGLVWHAGASGLPAAKTKFTITYAYNQVPTLVQQTIQTQWRLLGTDAQIHGGMARAYRFNIYIVYTPGYSQSSVNADVSTAIQNLVAGLGFRSALQVSDVLQTIHNVAGVDNVRFITSADGTDASVGGVASYGMQVMFPDGTAQATSYPGGRAADIYFDDATYPTFWSARIIAKARNTFGYS